VTSSGVTIGRAEDNDIVLDDEQASRRHARVFLRADGACVVEDLGSRHGTFVNDSPVGADGHVLASGDLLVVGGSELRFAAGEETRMASRASEVVRARSVRFNGSRMAIGRDASNDVVLEDPNVSRFHAEVVAADRGIEVVDLGSRNGTRLDGELIHRARLDPGAEIGIGPFGLLFDGASLIARDDHGALVLDARDVTVRAKGKEILKPTSLTISPGEMVAIIGESGAGKTTLLKAIAGVGRIGGGRITINGEPLATRLTDIGYVPQDDVVHGLLTVSEALNYAARLRLPQDASHEEIAEAVTRVLGELSLDGHAQQLIESLSGGQRKRTAVATELLARPSLLFLDEPTTGMDPGLETKMMLLFRELADESRALVLSTHATKNLALCDRVMVMGRGGVLTFDGPPEEALEFFAVETYDGIYDSLEAIPSSDWRSRFQESQAGGPEEAAAEPVTDEPQARERSRPVAALPQAVMLAGRYAKLLRRDRRNLLLLVGQAPVLGIAAVGLFRSGLFNRIGGDAAGAIELLFLMGLTTIWLGSVDAAREIIKERSVLEREYAVGLRLSAYLISKVTVLWTLVAVQVVLNVGILLLFRPLDEPASVYFAVFGLLIVAGFAAVGMGLLISTVANSEDQSMSLLPLALIPQILFAGTIVTVARMAQPAQTISYVISSQWSLAGLGTQLGMNDRMASDPQFARVNPFGSHFFDVPLAWSLLIQAGFFAAFIAIVSVVLHRRLRAIAR